MATIEAHEVEGVRKFIYWELTSEDVFPGKRSFREAHERIGWLLDADDALAATEEGQAVEIPDSRFLAEFARIGGEYGAELLGDVLANRTAHDYPEQAVRENKGLISFAHRLGVYKGVLV